MFKDVLNQIKSRGMNVLLLIIVWAVLVGGIVVWRMMNKNVILIDNPTDQAISFQLNGKEYNLEAKSNQKIKLADGEHKLVIDGEELSFTKKNLLEQDNVVLNALSGTPHGVLNPTRSDYVLAHQMYGNGPDSAWPEDIDYSGEVFFQVYADYGLNESLPHTLSMSRGTSYMIKTKLFRIEDYLKEYNIEE